MIEVDSLVLFGVSNEKNPHVLDEPNLSVEYVGGMFEFYGEMPLNGDYYADQYNRYFFKLSSEKISEIYHWAKQVVEREKVSV